MESGDIVEVRFNDLPGMMLKKCLLFHSNEVKYLVVGPEYCSSYTRYANNNHYESLGRITHFQPSVIFSTYNRGGVLLMSQVLLTYLYVTSSPSRK